MKRYAIVLMTLSFALLIAQEKSLIGTLLYLTSGKQKEWKQIPKAPFRIKSIAGNAIKGIIIVGGYENRQVAFFKDITSGQWEILNDAPFSIAGCSGDNAYGPIIYGGTDNRQVAYMRDYSKNIWIKVATAPFSITDIAGNNRYGPIIAGGENRRKVAYMRDYSKNIWKVVADAPFEVAAVAGDNFKGIIIAGGENSRQVAYMRDYSLNKWKEIASAPFSIFDLSGNNQYGPLIVGGEGNHQLAYLDNYQENRWKVLPDAPNNVVEIAGTIATGIIIGGSDVMKAGPKTIIKKVYKTAVVEFAERGNLGIKDAGVIIAEWLTTSLNKTGGFEVYERLSLNTLMKEHQLGMSGIMDEETIAEIGRIRGVEAIVTGSVIKFGDVISVTVKVIDVRTAKIIKSGDIKVTDINAISSEIDRLAWELAK